MARLGELLVAAGLLTTEQVDRALRAQVMWGARLGTNLIELGFIDLDTLSTVLAQQHKLPAALARHFEKVDRELQRMLHPDLAEMYTALPLVRVHNTDVVVASSSPLTKKAQARIADELAVDPEHIISAVAAELRMRYQLERVYNIQRPARFMRSPGKTIPPFPQFEPDDSDELDGDELLEVEPAVDEVKSTQPFLATYTAPTAASTTVPPANVGSKKPVPTVDEIQSVDVDMDDSSPKVPAKPGPAIGSLPFTKPSLPIPGVVATPATPAPIAPVVIKPRTAEARTGVAKPEPAPIPSVAKPSAIPSVAKPAGKLAVVTPHSEDEIQTVPVEKLDEQDVVMPRPAKPPAKFPSVAKFDAIADAVEDDKSERYEAIATPPPAKPEAPAKEAGKPAVIARPAVAGKLDAAKAAAATNVVAKSGADAAKPEPTNQTPAIGAPGVVAKSDAGAKPGARAGTIPGIAKPITPIVAKSSIVAKSDAARPVVATSAKPAVVVKSDAATKPAVVVKSDAAATPAVVAKSDAAAKPAVVAKSDAAAKPAVVAKSDAAEKPVDVAKSDAAAKTDTANPADGLFAKNDAGDPDGAWLDENARLSDPNLATRPVRAISESELSDDIRVEVEPLGAGRADADGIPVERPRRPGSESGAIAAPNPRTADLADLDALSSDVDDALSIPQVVDDDYSSGGRERRRYIRTIADAPTESERHSQSLGRIAIRKLAIAKGATEGHTIGEATRAIRRATDRDLIAELCIDTLFRFAQSCVAASLLVVRGQVATTWKGFIRDGSPPPEIAVPLDQPGLIPKAVHRNTTVRAPSSDLGPIDQLLMVSLAQKSGDMVIVPISIARQVMCVIALVTDGDASIATAESVAAGAGAAFARLMRDASR